MSVSLRRKTDMVKQVIILGGHIQALGLARQTADLGIPVILFIEDGYSVARYSRTVKRTVVTGSEERLSDFLREYEDTDTMLFPTADNYVNYLAAHYVELKQHFIVGIPDPETVALFGDKRRTYQFAEQTGIAHPKSWYPETLSDVEQIGNTAEFPLVVKPSVMYDFHRMFGKKAYRCDTKRELLERCRMIAERMPLSGLVIQEFLSGGARTLFSFGTFAINGEPEAWIQANRIRQNPMDFGNSTTFALTCNIPEIERSARTILKRTNYTGLAEVEFMYDEQAGVYKFLEINTRAWKWHSISTGLGFGFLSEWIHWLNGEPGDFTPSGRSMAWVERLTDLTIIVKETLKGKMNPFKALSTYCQKKVNAVWELNDPMPTVMYLILSPILFIKRH